ncbi:oxidoreductase [Aphelenchoides avenae]|nr:oxidoreductase [Aphelenchus avenae]
MVNVGTLKQSNGTELPILGYGTWLSNDPEQLKVALRAALDAGYRYIDTAFVYENEHVIGEVLQEYYAAGKLKRADLWITTKLALHMFRPEHVTEGIQYSLKALHTDYIDLYLMHTPTPCKCGDEMKPVTDANGKLVPDLVPHIDTWRVLEKYYKQGTLKSIGVSNFNVKQLQDLYDKAEVKPHNLQVEIHILHSQNELVNLCKKLGITVTSYGTLGSPGRKVGFKQVGAKDDRAEKQPEANCLEHPLVVELAKKYNKTPAQILLRQMMQRGISVIPKSTNAERVHENFSVLDFELTADEMKKFDEIKEDIRLFTFFL